MHKTITAVELIKKLNVLFPERDEVISAMVTAALAKEHLVIIGPPGTAKSLMVRVMTTCLDQSYFETLMHAFQTPEELFGPILLSGLQNDKYIRGTAGYAPEAQIVFLDEVFKSNAGMLNALLALLNERIVHNDGKAVKTPLVSCFGASNELPEGPQLSALYDRFMLRTTVSYINDKEAFKTMLKAGPPVYPGVVDLATEQAATEAVHLSAETVDALADLRYAYGAGGFTASDRRWRQSLGIIKATAHLAGRTTTEADDLECLEHVLWERPDQKVAVSKLVQGIISPDGARAVTELDNARDLFKRIPDLGSVDPGAYMGKIGQAVQDLASIVSRLQAMPKSRKVSTALAEVMGFKTQAGKLAMKAMNVDL